MLQIVHDETRPFGTITLRFGLAGQRDPMNVPYHAAGTKMSPASLTLTFTMDRSGEWRPFRWTMVGPRILKDRKLSAKTVHKVEGGFGSDRHGPERPAWVDQIAEKYQPEPTRLKARGDDVTVITFPEDS